MKVYLKKDCTNASGSFKAGTSIDMDAATAIPLILAGHAEAVVDKPKKAKEA